MTPAPEVATFSWGPAIAAWVGALIITLAGGVLTYRATIKAGREQAIETEKLRIRYGILRRRVEGFDQASIALQKFMHENPVTSSLEMYAKHHFRDLAVAVVSAAGIIDTSGPQPTGLLGSADQFNDACLDMADAASEGLQAKSRATQINEDDRQRIVERVAAAWAKIQTTFLDLQSAVDQAAEERLQSMA